MAKKRRLWGFIPGMLAGWMLCNAFVKTTQEMDDAERLGAVEEGMAEIKASVKNLSTLIERDSLEIHAKQ